MSKELTVNEEKKVVIDSKTIQDFLFSTGTKLSDKQKNMFMQLAIRNQLDPFKREIHAIPFGNDFNIVTGYQVYIQRAESTDKLDGWHCTAVKDAKGTLIGAKITIYRKDFAQPFEWEVSLSEFDKGQSNWKKMPEFMIKKVCIGQGFRLAFPNELGGMPYLQEELEELAPTESDKSPISPPQAKQPPTEVISEPQRKRLFAISKKAGLPEEDIKAFLLTFGFTSSKEITKDKYEEICTHIEAGDLDVTPECEQNPDMCGESKFDDKGKAFCGNDTNNPCKYQK